jgi:anti-sigma B factor antagonist
MECNTRQIDEILVIEIQGEIMGGTDSESFRHIIYDAIEENKVFIVADLKDATWMNSSGLGVLISGLTTLRSSGSDLRLTNLSEKVRRPLEITKLESVFLIYESVKDAVASYKTDQ